MKYILSKIFLGICLTVFSSITLAMEVWYIVPDKSIGSPIVIEALKRAKNDYQLDWKIIPARKARKEMDVGKKPDLIFAPRDEFSYLGRFERPVLDMGALINDMLGGKAAKDKDSPLDWVYSKDLYFGGDEEWLAWGNSLGNSGLPFRSKLELLDTKNLINVMKDLNREIDNWMNECGIPNIDKLTEDADERKLIINGIVKYLQYQDKPRPDPGVETMQKTKSQQSAEESFVEWLKKQPLNEETKKKGKKEDKSKKQEQKDREIQALTAALMVNIAVDLVSLADAAAMAACTGGAAAPYAAPKAILSLGVMLWNVGTYMYDVSQVTGSDKRPQTEQEQKDKETILAEVRDLEKKVVGLYLFVMKEYQGDKDKILRDIRKYEEKNNIPPEGSNAWFLFRRGAPIDPAPEYFLGMMNIESKQLTLYFTIK